MIHLRGRRVAIGLAGLALAAGGAAAASAVSASSASGASVDCSSTAAANHVTLTVTGGVATATFEISAGCVGVHVSLATYQANGPAGGFPQTFNASATGFFSEGGPYTLTAAAGPCNYQADLVLGGVITNLKSTGNPEQDIANGTLYGNRKLRVATGGTGPCVSPPPPPATDKPIDVFVTCIVNHAGSFDATFGYVNQNASSVTIPAGSARNTFAPAPGDRGQPSVFLPASHAEAFTVTGISDSSPVVWTVSNGGQTRSASASSSFAAKCTEQPPTESTSTGTTSTGTTSTGTTSTGTTSTGTTSTSTTPSGTTTVSTTPAGGQAGTTVATQTTAPSAVDIAVTKTAAPTTVSVGGSTTFKITVTDAGPGVATGTTLIDTLPAGLTVVGTTTTAGSCTTATPISCSLGTIAPGTTVVVTIIARVTSPGSHVNRAAATENEPDTNLSNNAAQATVTGRGPFVPPRLPARTARPRAAQHPARLATTSRNPRFTG
jgi:uncharacterized repeat protein (TIGR01451 family)